MTCPLVFISLCLPYQFSSFSFLRFCFERGYLLSSTAKGDYGKLENYPRRPFDELWPEGSEHLPVPDWKGFRRIWEERVPKLRIRNKSEDTCPECFILKNKFKYLGSRKRQPDDVDDPDAAGTRARAEDPGSGSVGAQRLRRTPDRDRPQDLVRASIDGGHGVAQHGT